GIRDRNVTGVQTCALPIYFENWELSMRSKIGALPLTVSTYDSNGQKIDQIKAKSVNIHTDKKMSQKDSNGNEKSSVIDIDYGHRSEERRVGEEKRQRKYK